MKQIMIVNGPNLNLLGTREPQIYGSTTLAELDQICSTAANREGLQALCRQSNHEGQIIDWIHEARTTCAGIVINAGGYTHTSVAIMDALIASALPVIEVHLSNIHRREEFRHSSFVARAAQGTICGLGAHGYELAIAALGRIIAKN